MLLFHRLCREWLNAVLEVTLQASWSTRKLAGQCVSRLVQRNSSWADFLLEGVNKTVAKVSNIHDEPFPKLILRKTAKKLDLKTEPKM